MSVYILLDPRPDRLWCYVGQANAPKIRFNTHAKNGRSDQFLMEGGFFTDRRRLWLGELYRENQAFQPIPMPHLGNELRFEKAWQSLVDRHPLCVTTNERRERRAVGEHLLPELVDAMAAYGQPHPWVWLSQTVAPWVSPGVRRQDIASWTVASPYADSFVVSHHAAPASADSAHAPDASFAADYLAAASLAAGGAGLPDLLDASFTEILPLMDLAPFRPGHLAFLRDFFGPGTMAARVLRRHLAAQHGTMEELALAYDPFQLDPEATVEAVLNGRHPSRDEPGWDDLDRLTGGLLARRWREWRTDQGHLTHAKLIALEKAREKGPPPPKVENPRWDPIQKGAWTCDPDRLTFSWL